jgi:hypothetical protein
MMGVTKALDLHWLAGWLAGWQVPHQPSRLLISPAVQQAHNLVTGQVVVMGDDGCHDCVEPLLLLHIHATS